MAMDHGRSATADSPAGAVDPAGAPPRSAVRSTRPGWRRRDALAVDGIERRGRVPDHQQSRRPVGHRSRTGSGGCRSGGGSTTSVIGSSRSAMLASTGSRSPARNDRSRRDRAAAGGRVPTAHQQPTAVLHRHRQSTGAGFRRTGDDDAGPQRQGTGAVDAGWRSRDGRPLPAAPGTLETEVGAARRESGVPARGVDHQIGVVHRSPSRPSSRSSILLESAYELGPDADATFGSRSDPAADDQLQQRPGDRHRGRSREGCRPASRTRPATASGRCRSGPPPGPPPRRADPAASASAASQPRSSMTWTWHPEVRPCGAASRPRAGRAPER